jgi:hypothetical protein
MFNQDVIRGTLCNFGEVRVSVNFGATSERWSSCHCQILLVSCSQSSKDLLWFNSQSLYCVDCVLRCLLLSHLLRRFSRTSSSASSAPALALLSYLLRHHRVIRRTCSGASGRFSCMCSGVTK